MSIVSVRIPQLGEGLQEARVVSLLKSVGDRVARDEPIYQMETDKAVMDVESPVEGTLLEWLVAEDEVLAIGAEVARIESESGVEDATPANTSPAAAEISARNLNIPPKTRAYAKEKGLSDEDLAKVASATGKLLPSDIDAFLGGGKVEGAYGGYSERQISTRQRVLNSRLSRSAQLVVPGVLKVVANWEPVERLKAAYRASGSEFRPSPFTMLGFAVAKTAAEYPAIRTALVGDDKYRTYDRCALGIAVGLAEDELVLAVIEDSDTLGWREFALRVRERIALAREGKDQATEAVTLSLTSMQGNGIRDAVPVVVPPSAATLFVGDVFRDLDPDSEIPSTRRCVSLVLTFDHRIMNGVGGARFLAAVKERIENIEQLLEGEAS